MNIKRIKYLLIADGSSDRTLIYIINWLLRDLYPSLPIDPAFADFRNLHNPPKSLEQKVDFGIKLYNQPDVIFIHRDAEKNDYKILDERKKEILNSLHGINDANIVCIIPIKMMESWLLIDSEAIKKGASNRNYSGNIDLPSIRSIEKQSQPKNLLHKLLRDASNRKGRNLEKFNVQKAIHLVAENIQDFSILRQLQAFSCFENDLKKAVDALINTNNITSD